MQQASAIVIGAGPAGLKCASELADAGIDTIVFDDNAQPGGQYFRQLPAGFGTAGPDPILRDQPRALRLLQAFAHPKIRFLPETTVWTTPGLPGLAYAGPHGSGRVEGKVTIAAAGAHDRPFPFDGWTLPGVLSAGGCLNLIKGQGMIPGRRVAVVGNGPLLLVVASSLIKAGATVPVVAEAAPSFDAIRQLPGLAWSPKLLMKGAGYRLAMARAGTRFLGSALVTAAVGTDAVTHVEIAPIDGRGAVDRGRAQRFEIDALVTGYGLTPSTELTRLLGCEHEFRPLRGGWVPKRNAECETSVPGVFAIGDCAGIGGVEIALLEAQAVSRIVAKRLGHATSSADVAAKLRRFDRFRDALNAVYMRRRLPKVAGAGTVICRCEELRLSELENAADAFGTGLRRLKAATRLSMGRCQGRNCLRPAAELFGDDTGADLATTHATTPRAPARPIQLSHLMDEPLAPPRTPVRIELGDISAEP